MTYCNTKFFDEDPIKNVIREVKSLARNPVPEDASWKNVKDSIVEAADFLRLNTNQVKPPIELTEIATLRRIHRIESLPGSYAPKAVLVPVVQGFLVKVPDRRLGLLNRFSIAHEIGHTFFYDLDKSPPVRLLAWGLSGTLSHKEENICDAFARALLMPHQLVETERKNYFNFKGLNLVYYLAHKFNVPDEIVVLRLLRELSGLDNTVVIFRELITKGKDPITTQIRKYFDKKLRGRFRKREKEALDVVTKAVISRHSLNELGTIARNYRDVLSIEGRVINRRLENQYYNRIILALHFHKSTLHLKQTENSNN